MTLRRRARFGRTIAACGIGSVGVFAGTPAFAFSCSAPLHPMQRIELMFGRNIGGHAGVGETAWSRFLAREITPRFPDGLTVVDAAGQWRDRAAGRLAREPSKLVIIVTASDPPADEKIAAIVAAYKQRFHQKSVGVAASPVCAMGLSQSSQGRYDNLIGMTGTTKPAGYKVAFHNRKWVR